jgi:recombinational DNA repair protein (RecF pathway)
LLNGCFGCIASSAKSALSDVLPPFVPLRLHLRQRRAALVEEHDVELVQSFQGLYALA